MQVYGREVGFRFTVGASAKIADLCPDGDIERLGELLDGSYGQVSRDTAAIVVALSEGYEQAQRFENPAYKPRPLSVEEIMSLRPAEFMDFGLALEAVKQGKRIARKGWNGKGMFLYYVPAAAYPPSTDVAKAAFGGENVPYGAYIAMKTAQGNVVPWLASQTDMLAVDWYIVD